jgi:hypothetical protein
MPFITEELCRPDHGNPLGARGDEHSAGDHAAAGLGECVCGDSSGRKHWSEFIQRLARVSDISFADAPPQGAVQLVVRGEVAALPLARA